MKVIVVVAPDPEIANVIVPELATLPFGWVIVYCHVPVQSNATVVSLGIAVNVEVAVGGRVATGSPNELKSVWFA
jgi:hypothetical protein